MSEIITNFLTFAVNPKCKEVHFKIMNHIYPAKEFLRVRFNVGDSNICQLCNLEIETVEHLFFYKHSGMMHSVGCTKYCL